MFDHQHHLNNGDLSQTARRAMTEGGFAIAPDAEVVRELKTLDRQSDSIIRNAPVRDLRGLLWSSIDNDSSRDLDQIEYAERLTSGAIKILVGIADVDALAPKNSPIDDFARHNTVTVYTEGGVFPMLPVELSTELTSLLPGTDRLAVVIEMIVAENGDVSKTDVYRALTHNYAKLTYEKVGAWLDENAPEPAQFAAVEHLREQILLQKEAAERLYQFRQAKGALEFETIESQAVKTDGKIVDLESVLPNTAQLIIENFMIAANVETAEFLQAKNIASIRRVVKTPARWQGIREIARQYGTDLPAEPDSLALSAFLEDRKKADALHFPDLSLSIIKLLGAGEYVVQTADEETGGHFGLAVRDYAHSTAPNRRYADLVVQRLLKSALENHAPPYTVDELRVIAARCNERESAARKIERLMRKIVAASVMQNRVGQRFEAIVTGITPSGTFARILRPPVDGRVLRGEENLRVGEQIVVRLLGVEVEKGFIDFAVDSNHR